jgi:DNA-binding NtrC family response regulator
MSRVSIFQVAYDASLLRVRAEMMKHVGFDVTSALGNEEAQRALTQAANHVLVVVGWSAPDSQRREMVCWLKRHFPALRVIALYSAGAREIPEADFNSCSEVPDQWFTAVKRAAAAA